MASFQVEWVKSAKKDLRKLPTQYVSKIIDACEALSCDPFPHGSKKLLGSEDGHRIRVGDYRVLYDVLETVLIVEIQAVGHRKDIYRK